MPDKDLTRYGLVGSPTTVERIFAHQGQRNRFTSLETLLRNPGSCMIWAEKEKYLQFRKGAHMDPSNF